MVTEDVLLLSWLRTAMTDGTARKIREDAGLSCAEGAGPAGVDQATVWRWEQGIRVPRGEAALRYGRLLKALQQMAAT